MRFTRPGKGRKQSSHQLSLRLPPVIICVVLGSVRSSHAISLSRAKFGALVRNPQDEPCNREKHRAGDSVQSVHSLFRHAVQPQPLFLVSGLLDAVCVQISRPFSINDTFSSLEPSIGALGVRMENCGREASLEPQTAESQ